MNRAFAFITRTIAAGLLIVVPIYLVFLLLLKGMQSVAGVVRPIARLLPESIPAETVLSLVLILLLCFIVGAIVRTHAGQTAGDWIVTHVLEKIPGYKLIRSLTQQVAGRSPESVWKPALFELDEGMMPAFIIEEFGDGRYTIFVPSIPTPFAGAVYIADRTRVHPLDLPMTEALKVVTRWGLGAKVLVAAMERRDATAIPRPGLEPGPGAAAP